jgi:DNA mismatch repair protein MutS2
MRSQEKSETSIVQKLDLDGYIEQFKHFLAREKPIALPGDINQHYRYIQALSSLQFPPPPSVTELDKELARIHLQAVLGLDEIYAFVKIIGYFNTLRAQSLPEPLHAWIQAIEIPDEIREVMTYFTHEGELNAERDPELYSLERAIKQNKSEIKETLYKLAHTSKLQPYLVDTQVHFNGGEETLLVRGGFNHVIKASVVARSTAGFFYIIPQSITQLKEKESALLSNKEEIIYKYCQKISTIFYTWERFLAFINKEYDRFDHYQARVSFARAYEYEFVLPSKKKGIRLFDFAHPAIENPKPISIDFSKRIMLVTGVNAGGKTMLLKSMLSAVYLSKHLLPFRCDAAKTEVGHYRHIEAVIDDPQSVKNDISTFAGRMQEFATLFSKEDAIVGVDEIELGTDSDEAASLFRVMLEALAHKSISFVVTTHHKRLASLMAADDEVELIAALYDEERRVPTYTFLQGSIGKSYAFETAQRYGIPASIITKAKEIYGEDKENLNELIEKSTTLERELRLKIAKADEALLAVENMREKLKDEEFRLQESHRKALATLENRYNAATKKAREALKAKESSEGRRLLNTAHQHTTLKPKEVASVEEMPLQEGDKVKYRSHKAELVSLHGSDATIMVDGLKIRVPLSQLKRRGDALLVAPKSKPKVSRVTVEKTGAAVSLKLLGMYADEALDALDKFLSDALVNGLYEVQIIHGTGGGVLSKLVGEYLNKHPKIAKFYKMPGNLGITVVEL